MLQYFLAILAFTAIAQMIGGYITGISVARFRRHIKKIVYVESALMLVVSAELTYFAFEASNLVIIPLVIGILAIFTINKFIPHKHGGELACLGTLVFIAMCMHELPEGISFGASYLLDPNVGLLTAALIALHNIPEGSIVMLPYALKNRVWQGLRIVGVTQALYVLGGLLSYALLFNLSAAEQALSTAFAAGAMIFIAIEEVYIIRKCKKK
jgi:ZIP family zinc transporter